MRYLLDVNLMIAAIWKTHADHGRADGWIQGQELASCAITDLGFLRLSTHPKVMNADMVSARKLLEDFHAKCRLETIACDFPVLKSSPKKSDDVTDFYLADLAHSAGMKLATLDTRIRHPAIELIP